MNRMKQKELKKYSPFNQLLIKCRRQQEQIKILKKIIYEYKHKGDKI